MKGSFGTSHALLGFGLALLVAGCEAPPPESMQQGFRGTAMVAVSNPARVAALDAANQLPPLEAPVPADGPLAGDVYQNVQVLKDLNVAEFTRLMVAMTAWVSPKEGCTYCHAGENFAVDEPYTKVVSRRMIEMTRYINSDWKSHVAETGVTCYTCHRGNPVPAEVWFADPGPKTTGGMAGNRRGQNAAAASVALASLPYDPFSPFLLERGDVRVESATALPAGNKSSIVRTEQTYALMIHMSDALGVNCTHCHNTRQFAAWDESTPPRATGWYGLRMARELNNVYLQPLTDLFPANRHGPLGDVAKINCATCHQGVVRPLNGASMLPGHPELIGPLRAYPAPMAETAPDTEATAESVATEPEDG